MRHKIVNPRQIDSKGKAIVLCSGCYDLMHIGHIKYLTTAKTFGDILVVSVTSDRFVNKGPGRPMFSQDLRMEQVASLEAVDYVVLSDSHNNVATIDAIKPAVYVKGDEYENLEADVTGNINKEKEAVEHHGGKLVFTHEATFSSTKLINNFFDPLTEATRLVLNSLPFSIEDVFSTLDSLSSLKVLVVGETIFDKYTFVKTLNVSSKHSVVCSKFLRVETHYGGAVATARHISKFCNNVSVVTVLNNNYYEELITAMPTINFKFVDTHSKRTIIKERFIDEKGKQLFRVDNMHDDPYYEHEDALCKSLSFDDYDLIVINDFGHGMMTPKVIMHIEDNNYSYKALNVQTNSANKGFNLVTKYADADYLSIDMPEAQLALSDKVSSIEDIATKLCKQVPNGCLSITHGQYGTNIFREKKYKHMPVFSTDVVDSTGAGDAYFGITSLLAYAEAPIEMIGLIGNAVGALAIRILGNKEGIDPILLRKYLTTLLKK